MARIVLVDDDPVAGEVVCAALIAAGHAAGWVSDSRSALGILLRRPPQLAILDSAMPGLSGIQLLMAMRDHGSLCDVPVIMLTARLSPRDEAIAIGAGAVDYLRKPIDLDLMLGRIDAALYRRPPSAIAPVAALRA